MSYYTAKYVRDFLADLPDDEPVAGMLMLRQESVIEEGDDERVPTPEEWVEIVDRWEGLSEDLFTAQGESLRDVIYDLHQSSPNPDGEGPYTEDDDWSPTRPPWKEGQ